MCYSRLLAGCLVVSLLAACKPEEGTQPPEDYAKAKSDYDILAARMGRSFAYVTEPLRDLTEEEMASVAALVMMTQVVARAEGQGALSGARFDRFWTDLEEICPTPPQPVDFRLGGCLDEEIAYATAMAKCLDEGKSEDECDKEAAGEGYAALMCRMRQIEDMRGVIVRIPGRDWPPDPFPWLGHEPM